MTYNLRHSMSLRHPVAPMHTHTQTVTYICIYHTYICDMYISHAYTHAHTNTHIHTETTHTHTHQTGEDANRHHSSGVFSLCSSSSDGIEPNVGEEYHTGTPDHVNVCVNVCVCVCVSLCVSVCVRACVCACVCACLLTIVVCIFIHICICQQQQQSHR